MSILHKFKKSVQKNEIKFHNSFLGVYFMYGEFLDLESGKCRSGESFKEGVKVGVKIPGASAPGISRFIALLMCPFGKKIVAFVIYNDKSREIFHADFAYGFHSQFFKIDHFDRLDAVFG